MKPSGPAHSVLVIEDNAIDYELVRRLLPATYQTVHAPTASAGIGRLQSQRFDGVLLDYRLPDIDGIDVLSELVEFGVPVIVLTGQGDMQVAVDAMKLGAADYLRKDRLDRETLSHTVATAIERATLRRELANRDAELRALAEKLPALVWSVDTAGRITGLHGARLATIGLAGHDARGQRWVDVFAPVLEREEDTEELAAAHLAALDGRSSRFELRLCGRIFEGHLVPLPGPGTSCAGATGLLLDVSESHALEHKLVQAQKLEAIGRLASGLAHDMNNILTAVVSFTSFAREEAASDSQLATDLDEVLRAADRGTNLLRQMLLFSRRETFAQSTLAVRDVVRETLPMLRRLVGEDCRVDLLDADEDIFVEIDRSKLEQIVVNLAVNARDAMNGAGRILIELSTTTFDAPRLTGDERLAAGSYVIMKVIDSGGGIPPELLDRVFEPFFTTKERGKGTGLGLATCRAIARQSGGTIVIDSEVGRGTEIGVYLPRSLTEPTLELVPSAAAPRGGTETVLLVEDDSPIRAATARVLRKLGYTVLDAEDLETALTAARRHDGEIAIAVTDMVLPGGSGREVVATLRRTRPGLRAIYVSGYAPDSLRLRGHFEIGDVLEKPFTTTELARRVRAKLDDERPTPSLIPA